MKTFFSIPFLSWGIPVECRISYTICVVCVYMNICIMHVSCMIVVYSMCVVCKHYFCVFYMYTCTLYVNFCVVCTYANTYMSCYVTYSFCITMYAIVCERLCIFHIQQDKPVCFIHYDYIHCPSVYSRGLDVWGRCAIGPSSALNEIDGGDTSTMPVTSCYENGMHAAEEPVSHPFHRHKILNTHILPCTSTNFHIMLELQ